MQVEHVKTATKTRARVLKVHTVHGSFLTPVFMPVGTRAGVNNLTPDELKACGSQIILGGNTYHMLCKPGMDMIQEAGGMHRLMGWPHPMLTDSGGFQIFSLSKRGSLCVIDEGGAHFSVPNRAEKIYMTPTVSMQAQKIIGADIIMAFDQCTPLTASADEAAAIMTRTHRWLLECVDYQTQYPNAVYGFPQALFGIVQGGIYDDLRLKSAEFIVNLPVDGIALGGEAVGFDMVKTVEIIRSVYDLLPKDKPRYTMGVGMSPQDLLDVIKEGIDMFDCVAPTRNARHGSLYSGKIVAKGDWFAFESEFKDARLSIKKAVFAKDDRPIMEDCTCWTCQHHTRAYLHHLLKSNAVSFMPLACVHNIHVMQEVCRVVRERM